MVTELKIDLGEEEVRSLVAEGILASLTDKKREELLRASLSHLLDPTAIERKKRDSTRHYEKEKVSRLQVIWEQESEREMRNIISEELSKSEELQKKMKELFLKAMDKFFGNEAMVDRVATSMSETFTKSFPTEYEY